MPHHITCRSEVSSVDGQPVHIVSYSIKALCPVGTSASSSSSDPSSSSPPPSSGQPSASPPSLDVLVLLIPGNPGITHFYTPVLELLTNRLATLLLPSSSSSASTRSATPAECSCNGICDCQPQEEACIEQTSLIPLSIESTVVSYAGHLHIERTRKGSVPLTPLSHCAENTQPSNSSSSGDNTAGKTMSPSNNAVFSQNNALFGLHDQVLHFYSYVRARMDANPRLRVVLVGHSIGAYIVQHVMQLFEESADHARVTTQSLSSEEEAALSRKRDHSSSLSSSSSCSSSSSSSSSSTSSSPTVSHTPVPNTNTATTTTDNVTNTNTNTDHPPASSPSSSSSSSSSSPSSSSSSSPSSSSSSSSSSPIIQGVMMFPAIMNMAETVNGRDKARYLWLTNILVGALWVLTWLLPVRMTRHIAHMVAVSKAEVPLAKKSANHCSKGESVKQALKGEQNTEEEAIIVGCCDKSEASLVSRDTSSCSSTSSPASSSASSPPDSSSSSPCSCACHATHSSLSVSSPCAHATFHYRFISSIQHGIHSIANPRVMRNVLYLFRSELRNVRACDDAWVRKCANRLVFIYTPSDGWAPADHYEHIKKVMTEAGHPNAVYLDKSGVEHAYMLRSCGPVSDWLADRVCHVIKEQLANMAA